MKRYCFILVALSCLLFIVSSCRKKADVVGGKGGTSTFVLYPQHHAYAWPISRCTIYIKYNTKEDPHGVYDDSVVCVCADSLVKGSFTGLKNGDYYLVSMGYDSSIHKAIHGGVYLPITQQNTTSSDILIVGEE